jgi:cell division protein FtsB
MALTEAFGKKAKEYDDCAKRMKQLQESLSGIRSRRLDNIVQKNASLVLFIDLWKNEEDRKRMLLIAKAREIALKDEMDRLEDESEYVAKVIGISKTEILNN